MSKKECVLTPQQRDFCHIRHDDPTIAAYKCVHRAYPGKFKTDASAAAHASRLLKSDKIQRYLTKLGRELQNRIGATIGRIMLEEARIAFADPGQIIDQATRQNLPIDKLPDSLRRAVKEVRIVRSVSLRDPDIERTEYRYRFHSKDSALARLERINGMNEKDWEQQKKAQSVGETKSEKWVLLPTDRELTLKEWAEQVDELNRYQEEKQAKEQKHEEEPA